jgi:type IV secretory pathway VirB4 component
MTKYYQRTEEISGDIIDREMPTRFVEDGIIVNKDLSLSVGWRVTFPNLYTQSEADKESIFASLRSALNTLPDHFDLQVIFLQHSRSAETAQTIASPPIDNAIVGEYLQAYTDNIVARLKARDLRFFEGYIMLVRKCTLHPNEIQKRTKANFHETPAYKESSPLGRFFKDLELDYFSSSQQSQYELAEYNAARDELFAVADSLQNTLGQCRLSPDPLSSDGLIELLYKYNNPLSWEKGGKPRAFSAKELLPATEYYIKSNFVWDTKGVLAPLGVFKFDDAYHKVMTVRTPPTGIWFSQFQTICLRSWLNNFRVIVNLQHGSIPQRKKQLEDQMRQVKARVDKDITLRATLEDIENELLDLGRNVEKYWLATHVIHVWGDTPKQVDDTCRRLKELGEEAEGMVISDEIHALWPYWRSSQPGWTRDVDRYRQNSYNTAQVVGLLPVCGVDSNLNNNVGVIFPTLEDSIYNFYPHDTRQFTNYNGLIIGGSGTGKSFLVSTIAAQMKKVKARQVFIDIGGSYRNLCQVMRGTYIDMNLTSDVNRINPFDPLATEKPDPDVVDATLAYLEKMMTDPAEGSLSRVQMGILEEVLNDLIGAKRGEAFYISDFRLGLQRHSKEGEMLARRLVPFCAPNGRYRNLADGPTQQSFDNPFIVFDLTSFKDSKELCPIAFTTIIAQILKIGDKYPGEPKFLYIDEAWSMLADPVLANFVVYAFRALRKKNFATVAISQAIEEFANTSNKTAILANISHLLVLRQNNSEAIRLVAQEFGLSETEQQIVGGLQTSVGNYSQFLLRQKLSNGTNRSTICVNQSHPLLYAMATTKQPDLKKIYDFVGSGMGHTEAILKFAQEYPKGVF